MLPLLYSVRPLSRTISKVPVEVAVVVALSFWGAWMRLVADTHPAAPTSTAGTLGSTFARNISLLVSLGPLGTTCSPPPPYTVKYLPPDSATMMRGRGVNHNVWTASAHVARTFIWDGGDRTDVIFVWYNNEPGISRSLFVPPHHQW